MSSCRSRGNAWPLMILMFALTACGGGSTTATNDFGQDSGPGVMVGEITGVSGGIPQLGQAGDGSGGAGTETMAFNSECFVPDSQLAGSHVNAPLGTNPEYNTRPFGSIEITRNVSRVGSSLDPGEQFNLDWLAVTRHLVAGMSPEGLAGFDPETGLNEGPFTEGEAIDLWMAYEVADGNSLSREWHVKCEADVFDFSVIDDLVTYTAGGDNEPGAKLFKLTYLLPVSCAGTMTMEVALTNGIKTESTVIIVEPVFESSTMVFEVTPVPTQISDNPPPLPPPDNPPDCFPEWINVDFYSEDSVYIEAEKELSNVVLKFADYTIQKFEDLSGYSGSFAGTGEYSGKTLIGVWIKAGCNASGDGPGYGEFFPATERYRHAMMVWEDLLVNSDYDYNDFVASMHATEILNAEGDLIQVNLMIKALARGAGYGGDWQFNIESSFQSPGADVQALVRQYYADGTPHGALRIWNSGTGGACVPIFAPVSEALPIPPDHPYATNVVPGTTYIEGDYADVYITFNPPLPIGSYEPWPYDPELRVKPAGAYSEAGVYIVKLWRSREDNATRLDNNGRPLAFIVPDTYAWPLERKLIWSAFPSFNEWVYWINHGGVEPNPIWSQTEPVQDYFDRELFK